MPVILCGMAIPGDAVPPFELYASEIQNCVVVELDDFLSAR